MNDFEIIEEIVRCPKPIKSGPSPDLTLSCKECGKTTEVTCQDCEEPVCEECLVQMTVHNPVDYNLCQACEDYRQAKASNKSVEECKRSEEVMKKKEKANRLRRKNYGSLENVEKRRMAKATKKKEQERLDMKAFEKTLKIMGEFK